MMTAPHSAWFPRTLTFVVWALAAASAVFWGLRWDGKASLALPVATVAPSATVVDGGAVARLFGNVGAVTEVAANAPNRLQLAGVVARTASHTGAALIAIDGKPAKAFSVGSRVEEGLFLRSVQGRQASLAASSEGPVSMTLELAAPSPASLTGPDVARAGALSTPVPAHPAPPGPAPRVSVSLPTSPAAPPRTGARVKSAETGDTQD